MWLGYLTDSDEQNITIKVNHFLGSYDYHLYYNV